MLYFHPNAMTPSAQAVTELLNQWAGGDRAAGEKVLSLVYGELRRIARRCMHPQGPHTLQTTALVHQAYMRLVGDSGTQWENRAHFFGVAAKAMRHVLVDYALAGAAAKRGGPKQARGVGGRFCGFPGADDGGDRTG